MTQGLEFSPNNATLKMMVEAVRAKLVKEIVAECSAIISSVSELCCVVLYSMRLLLGLGRPNAIAS